MMYRVTITDDIANSIVRLRKFQKGVDTAMSQVLFTLSARLVSGIMQRVHVITGALRRGWVAVPPQKTATGWQGGAANNKPYMMAEEFGNRKPQTVREYTRRTLSGGTVSVRSHLRTANHPEHPSVRPAIAALSPDISPLIVQAIREVAEGSGS